MLDPPDSLAPPGIPAHWLSLVITLLYRDFIDLYNRVWQPQVERWPIDKLISYARNPRTHSDGQVPQIAASIAEFGFNNPILVDTHDGMIAGHGRLLAARKLQLREVPVIVLDHLSETQKRAYVIADNRLAENAGWDDELLRLELETPNQGGAILA